MFVYGRPRAETTDSYTQQQLRTLHLRQIFDIVLERGTVARSAIAKELKLSQTAVSSLADELLYAGALVTAGAGILKGAGRRPQLLELNRSWKQIVTFMLNPKHAEYALCDSSGQITEALTVPVQGSNYVEAVREAVRTSPNIHPMDVAAVCVAVPAITDAEEQRLLLNVLDMEDDREFLDAMASLFPEADLLVGNDSAAYAYAEKEYGAGKDVQNLIYINYTHGIGAGIVVDGTIFNEDKYRTGEIGHMSIDINGPQCICGNRGCLERVASIPAIVREASQAIEDGGYSVLIDLGNKNAGGITIDRMIEAYRQGDRLTEQIIDSMAEKLSVGIRNLLCMFHPEEVVIGGMAHRFGERFLQKVKDSSRGTFYWDQIYQTEIRYTRIEEYGANLGMAKYYLDQILTFDKNWAGQTDEYHVAKEAQ